MGQGGLTNPPLQLHAALTLETDRTVPQTRLMIPETRRGITRRLRLLRAVYHNALGIWHEFRLPILILAVAIFGGGWLYRELMVAAGYERLPYGDMPYTMVALMALETPVNLPREPELVAFWYIMPLVLAYVAGRGVFDFVRLFFDPKGHENDWEQAVASTYRNHVIVLGVGHLGLRVIRSLVQMGFEVVAIDIKTTPEKSNELAHLHVPLVVGDGRLVETMENAGLPQAQSFIVCTSNDYMNLEVTMRARDLNPDIRIVVRMWEDQFAAQICRFLNVEAVLSATDIAAPSFAGSAVGIEISQALTVNGEDYSMIRLQVAPGSFLDGETVGTLQDEHAMDIVLMEHADVAQVHPPRDSMVSAGDTLVIFAREAKVIDVVARNQKR